MNNRGMTLPELLLALSLSAILTALIAPLFLANARLAAASATREQQFQATSLIVDTVARAFKQSKSVVALQLLQQRTNHSAFNNLSISHRPHPNSAVLTVVELLYGTSLSVTAVNDNAITGCLQNTPSSNLLPKFWVGVSLQGSTIFSAYAKGNHGSCDRTLVPVNSRLSFILTNNNLVREHLLIAYPIESIYSLYVDNENTFRRSSLSALESQPIAYEVTHFQVQPEDSFTTVTVAALGSEIRSFTFSALQPSPLAYLDLVL